MLTGPEAGITRDAIGVDWEFKGRPVRLVDTAGLRRKARIQEKLEKLSVGDALRARAGPKLRKLEEGFGENAFSYMLVLRLVPIFPFFLVNLAPAFLGVRLGTYVLATFIGIMPGTFVFASLGNGLGAVFDAGREPDLGLIFEPQIIGPILALALLALVPVVYRRFAGKSRLPDEAA